MRRSASRRRARLGRRELPQPRQPLELLGAVGGEGGEQAQRLAAPVLVQPLEAHARELRARPVRETARDLEARQRNARRVGAILLRIALDDHAQPLRCALAVARLGRHARQLEGRVVRQRALRVVAEEGPETLAGDCRVVLEHADRRRVGGPLLLARGARRPRARGAAARGERHDQCERHARSRPADRSGSHR
jgi:hypothetical protein